MDRRTNSLIQPDILDLRAFCLVVDFGSLTEAAQVLQETKGSISRRLSRLEELLGVTLLQRSPRLVQATEEGMLYRKQIGQAIELLDNANAAVQHAQEAPKGLLRVTAPHDLGLVLFAPIIADFASKHSGISVDVILTGQHLDFDEHQIDFAFRATATLKDSTLIAHKLCDVTGVLVASPAYLERVKPPSKPDELSGHSLLLNRSIHSELTLRHSQTGELHSLPRLSPIITAEMSFLAKAACTGAGIAVVPLEIVQPELSAGLLKRVLPEYQVSEMGKIYLLHRSWQFLPPKIRAFREFAIQRLAQECENKK
jgi:DNA-binding transcriptional LysR family regulator